MKRAPGAIEGEVGVTFCRVERGIFTVEASSPGDPSSSEEAVQKATADMINLAKQFVAGKLAEGDLYPERDLILKKLKA